MGYLILITLQFAALVAVAIFFWRRLERQRGEIASLREALRVLQEGGAQQLRRAVEAGATAVPVAKVELCRDPAVRVAPSWRLRLPEAFKKLQRLQTNLPVANETVRGALIGIAAVAPALAFLFNVDHALIVACGLCIAGGMMLLGLQDAWRAATWGAVLSGCTWTLIGFAAGIAQAHPLTFSVAVAIAGAAGLVYAMLRGMTPGALLTLTMAAAVLLLGALSGMIGPAGIAFATLVVLAAIVGALSLRLEPIHLAAFGATLLGLFVMSGQPSAAIWFTPVAAWAGALFLAIAAVQAPRLGARGIAIAGTGAFAPLMAVAAIYGAHQGLADPRAAGGAFAVLAMLLSGVIALAAQRRGRGLEALKLTLWVLASSAFAAVAAGVALALPPPFAAPAFATLAGGLMLLDMRAPAAAWRTFACLAAALAAFDAAFNVGLVLSEAPAWDARLVLVAGLAAPAALVGSAGYFAQRKQAVFTAGLSKAIAIALSVATADVLVRLLFSGGAPLLQPIGFVEAGFHVAAWLTIALYVAAGTRRHPSAARTAAALALSGAALGVSLLIAALWLTPYWTTLAPARVEWPILRVDALGFFAPAILFWAHWVFWRARGSNVRTRVALGAGALMSACAVTLEVMKVRDGEGSPDTMSALIGALAFATAIVINFAPGVVATESRRLHLEEDFQRNRRSEQSRQAR